MPEISEDCWDGYEKKGMKTMFGKRYPNCVKKKKTRKESFEINPEKHKEAQKKQKMRNLTASAMRILMRRKSQKRKRVRSQTCR